MVRGRWCSAFVFVALLTSGVRAEGNRPSGPAENVILVLIDGLRWQEAFTGPEEALMGKDGGVADESALKKEYWRDTPEVRREVLMPFLWKTVAREGQIFGNQNKGSVVRVANRFNFSYPGHNEMLVGYFDPTIDSNDPRPNPNKSVFEWLNSRPRFRGQVAAFGMWDTITAILNKERCGFPVNGGLRPVHDGRMTPQIELLNEVKADLPSNVRTTDCDALLFYSAIEYFKANEPRAFYLAFDETDEWAHEGKYADVLESIRRTDHLIHKLWDTIQALPKYRGKTTLIIATDHGRGSGPSEWKHHGEKIAGAQNVWLAVMGPGVPPLGERTNTPPLTLSQVAATVAAAVGEDYRAATPKAAQPINLAPGAADQR
jgi:hypothetical protein